MAGVETVDLGVPAVSFGTSLLGNQDALRQMDEMVIDLAAGAVEQYRHEIGDLIATTVAGWIALAPKFATFTLITAYGPGGNSSSGVLDKHGERAKAALG